MTFPSPADLLERLGRGLQRQSVKAVNGIRYLSGQNFAPPDPTPKDTVWRQGKVELWRYRSDDIRQSPPVLLMLGLVSRSSLFDLHRNASLVRALRDAGFDVYVLDWGIADAGDAENTVETYIERYLPRAIRAVLRTSGVDDLTLAGYCMGGNLALIAKAAHPELPIRNLVTMATGVDWDHMHRQVDPLRRPGENGQAFLDDRGLMPGEAFAYFFKIRKPTADLLQWLNLWRHLDDTAYVEGHQAIARWATDHVPVPFPVARTIFESWLRENAFATGRLSLGGAKVDLGAITCPVLAILTQRDEIVPAAAARPIREVLTGADVELLELDAGHVGLAVGRAAHRVLYPRLIDWLIRHGRVS